MAVSGISNTNITGTLGGISSAFNTSKVESDRNKFQQLLEEMSQSKSDSDKTVSGVSSSQISKGSRLNGDYTKGFYGTFTSEADKHAAPQGFAVNAKSADGKKITIDKTSDLYAQSMEMENYLIKTMISSMRKTIVHSELFGSENSYARNMYEDMMYDNVAEAFTKNSHLGLADQIYIELSQKQS
ncbi:MAG: rod-binding protein [Treponema sp.]|nr:rod-binding protein [Spirochaetia bacterium]MDY4901629.1 rod-binding protein [Treponema sp.]